MGLFIVVLLSTALLAGATPVAASTGGSVSLSISRTEVDAQNPTTLLTATTSEPMHAPYMLSIYDADTHALLRYCYYNHSSQPLSCQKHVTLGNNSSQSFIAYIAQELPPSTGPPTAGLRATSGTVSATHTGWHGSVTLSISRTEVDAQNPTTLLTATTTVPLRAPYMLSIYDADTHALLRYCYYNHSSQPLSCEKHVTLGNNSSRSFIAYIAQDAPPSLSTGPPTNDVRAVSGTVSAAHTGWHGGVSLTVDQSNTTQTYQKASLTATTSVPLRAPYMLSIYDAATHERIRSCYYNHSTQPLSCSTYPRVPTNGMRSFIAYVAQDHPVPGPPTNDVRAVSGTVPGGVVDSVNIALFLGLASSRGIGLAELLDEGCEYIYLTRQPDPTPHTSTDGADEVCLAAESSGTTIEWLLADLAAVAGAGAAYALLNDVFTATEPRRFDDVRRAAPIPPNSHYGAITTQTEELDAAPEPQVAAAGAGIGLPPRCIDDATWTSLLDTAWQTHHLASDKQYTTNPDGSKTPNGYTDLFVRSLQQAGMLQQLDPDGRWDRALNQSWNTVVVPHVGPHPVDYHQWVLDNLNLALQRAGGDVDLFKALFREYVAKPILADPTAVRSAWWACQ